MHESVIELGSPWRLEAALDISMVVPEKQAGHSAAAALPTTAEFHLEQRSVRSRHTHTSQLTSEGEGSCAYCRASRRELTGIQLSWLGCPRAVVFALQS